MARRSKPAFCNATRMGLLIVAAAMIAAPTVMANDLELVSFTISGGGGYSIAGDLELEGTIGQPEAGPELSGGDLTLKGGFWPSVKVVEPTTWFRDADGDGFGNPDEAQLAAQQPSGFVDNADDCDDTNHLINPAVSEICGNGIDENCDGSDERCPTTWFRDADGDGFGNPEEALDAVEQPSGFVDNADDCDDTNHLINPAAIEICGNGIDENCDGTDEACVDLDPNAVNRIPPVDPNAAGQNPPEDPNAVEQIPPAVAPVGLPCGLVASLMLSSSLIGAIGTRKRRR